MSSGDMYAEPSLEDVQKDVQAEAEGQKAGTSAQPAGSGSAGCLGIVLVVLGLPVLVIRMFQ